MSTLWDLLRRRPGFRRLWLGETVSLAGDWLSYVAISLLALQAGGGAFALAVVLAAHMLPAALVSPLAGVAADRFDRRRVLVITQLLQAALMVAMVFAAQAQHLLAVELLLFARTAVAGFFLPAKQAALRRVVAPEELVDANALDSATWSVVFAVGTALGGLLALLGPVIALSVDALTFVLAAWILAGLEPIAPAANRAVDDRGELRVAWRYALAHPELVEAVWSKTPMALAGGAGWVMLNASADGIAWFGAGALALGSLQAVRGVGTGVGPMWARRFLRRQVAVRRLLRASLAVSFTGIALFAILIALSDQLGATLSALGLLVAAFVWGAGGGGAWVFSASEIQRRAPDEMQGRLSALDQLGFMLAMSAGAFVAAFVVDASGVVASAGAVALGLGLTGWAALLAFVHTRQSTHTSSLATQRA